MRRPGTGRLWRLPILLVAILLLLGMAGTARDQGTGGGLLFPGETILVVMTDGPFRFTPVADDAVIDVSPALRQIILDPAGLPFVDLVSGFPAGVQIKPLRVDLGSAAGWPSSATRTGT